MHRMILIACVCACALPAFAARYFIDPYMGVDSHTKKQAQIFYLPWKHIQTGIDSAAAGDTLLLDDNTFAERLSITKPLCILGDTREASIIHYPYNSGYGATVVTIAPGVDGVSFVNISVNGGFSIYGGAEIGVLCGAGVDSVRLVDCAVVHCGVAGLMTQFDASADGAVNDGFDVESCLFQNILDGQGGAQHSCALWCDRLAHSTIRDNVFRQCGLGVWISGSALPDSSAGTGVVIRANNLHDLTQNALVFSGLYNSVIDSNVVQRCAQFTAPDSAWTQSFPGAVSLTGPAANVVMNANVVRDNLGFTGDSTFYTDPVTHLLQGPGYNGWPGVFIAGASALSLVNSSISGNRYGGVFIAGAAAQVLVNNDFIYANGDLNNGGRDYGLSAPLAAVNAKFDWWGLPVGPVYDGAGIGNGIYGAGVVAAPFVASTEYALSYTPQRLIFYVVHVGDYQDLSFDFYNAGPGPAITSSPFIGGASSSQFSILTPTASQIIAPFDTLHVVVRFQPEQVGLLEANANVALDSAGRQTIGPQLIGFGGLAVLSTADTLAFDTLAPGRCAVKTLTIHNGGTELLGITGASITGADSAEFAVLDSLPLVVPQYTDAHLRVEFCPAFVAHKQARLVLTGNTLPPQTFVQLIGASDTVSRLAPARTVIDFGTHKLGDIADSDLTVRNTATVTLRIDSAYVVNDANGEFSLRAPALPVALSAGGTAALRIRYSATVRGAATAALRVVASDGTHFTIALAGRAAIELLATLPDTLFRGVSIAAGGDSEQCAYLINAGDYPFTVFLGTIGGERAMDYSLLPFTAGVVQPGDEDTICVTYHPTHAGYSPAMLLVQLANTTPPLDTIYLAGSAFVNGVAAGALQPQVLLSSYPNPFSQETAIHISVPVGAAGRGVSLAVLDALGRQAADLTDAARQAFARGGDILFDARALPAGVYFLRAEIGARIYTKMLEVVK